MTEAENRNPTEPRYRFCYLLGSLLMLLVGMALADKHPIDCYRQRLRGPYADLRARGEIRATGVLLLRHVDNAGLRRHRSRFVCSPYHKLSGDHVRTVLYGCARRTARGSLCRPIKKFEPLKAES